MIEALRDIGYSLETAVSDILDNSITAGADLVDIRFGWEGLEPWIAIADNGIGMSLDGMLDAMRPGSKNPKEQRSRNDLGRFGLGLKTASFSQCRRLTVISRLDGNTSALAWDLDQVSETDEWLLQRLTPEEQALLPMDVGIAFTGTIVLWQKLDRLDLGAAGSAAQSALNERIGSVRSSLSLVFHRYLEGEHGKNKISVRINNLPLEPFDPFNAKCLATQHLLPESVAIAGETIHIQPFVLPHHTKVAPGEYERLAGAEGYLRSQGFYVYRNRRLIVHGTWFRLARQEELTKLARVRIDIPNTLDHHWSIDVKKSRAQPPRVVRQKMKQVIERIRDSARRPYTKRAVIVAERTTTQIWSRKVSNTSVNYSVNSSHPIIQELRLNLEVTQRKQLDAILNLVAEYFPATLFFSDYAANPNALEKSDSDERLLEECIRMLASANPELDADQLRSLLKSMEPFASKPERIDQMTSLIR